MQHQGATRGARGEIGTGMNVHAVWAGVVVIGAAALGCGPHEAAQLAAASKTNEVRAAADDRIWRPNDTRPFPERLSYDNALGVVTTVNIAGSTDTQGHPFFTPLGTNGRACISCHQPADGMSLSTSTLQTLWRDSTGTDPVFAAIDGSNCPNLPQEQESSHSLLLEYGLFRIVRSWPPRAPDGQPLDPEFELEVVRDPTGCNTDASFGVGAGQVSVYRRPRPATNLRYVTAIGFSFDPKNGLPLALDPVSGQPMSGNLLSDVRTGTLEGQAADALVSHIELHTPLDRGSLERILEFERGLYTAQSSHLHAGNLSEAGAEGGPDALAAFPAGALQSSSKPIWSEFFAWDETPAVDGGSGDPQEEFRRSVARGAKLFSKRTFLVTDSAGITDMGFGNPVRNSCAFCHNMQHVGLDVAPGQIDLGTTNWPHVRLAAGSPAGELPLFRLTCKPGARPHAHLGRVVYTHDPGYALTTGRCIDIGKITAQTMRGLAARAPFFATGSVRTMREIVDFYEERYTIGFTEQEKQDLSNFLEVL
jgi:hypothetical protein